MRIEEEEGEMDKHFLLNRIEFVKLMPSNNYTIITIVGTGFLVNNNKISRPKV